MRDRTNICLTCLSVDRRLCPLYKMTSLIQEINFVEVKGSTNGLCWECCCIVIKYQRFKKRAQAAQDTLKYDKEHLNHKSLTTLKSKTNLYYDYQFTYNFDPLAKCDTEPKTEQDSIKQEFSDNTDDNINNTSDTDEKETDVTVEIEVTESNSKKELRNIETNIKNDNNFEDTVLTEEEMIANTDIDEKLAQIENVYVDIIEIKPQNNSLRKPVKITKEHKKVKTNKKYSRNTEIRSKADEKEVKEKFVEVVLTEEEMVRVREEKRNHHNFKKIPYKCDSCVLGFTRKETYNIHMEKKHDELFISDWRLKNHRQKHHGLSRTRDHSCNVCGKKFFTIATLRGHQLTHSEQRSYMCEDCGDTFKQRPALYTHMRLVHKGGARRK